jgi:hypothetical protein
MKTLSVSFNTHINQESSTVCMAIKVVFTKFQPQIVNITKANPGVVEVLWAPDYITGDSARIVNVRGMTELNNTDVQLIKIDSKHFSIGVNTTGYGTYTAKGELRRILGATEFIHDFTFQNVTYLASVGYMPKSIKAGSDMSVDNLQIRGLMTDKVRAQAQGLLVEGLSDEDLRVGRFDDARVELFLFNYENLSHGRLILPGSGRIGQIRMLRGVHESELRGLMSFIQSRFGDLYSKLCRAQLGDDIDDYRISGFGCKVRLDPPYWKAATPYTVRPPYDASKGSVVKPTTFVNRHLKCTVAGISHATTEPVCPGRIGDTVTDGTVIWEAIQALTVFGSVTSVLDTRFFSDSARSEPPATGLGVNTATTQYAIRKATVATKQFELEGGDIRSLFPSGSTFPVVLSKANDGTYTVSTTALVGARTRITTVEAFPSDHDSGFVTAPLLISSGFFQYGKLTFLTGANKGISKEIKDFTLSNYAIVDVDQGSQLFIIDGDQSAFFTVDQHFTVNQSSDNDGEYDVVSVTYNGGNDETEIEVFQAIPDAVADGSILGGPGQFELFERFPFTIVVGDQYMATAGCDLSKTLCGVRFDNMYNRRAEDEIPGTDVALLTPNADGGVG